ncbi:cell division ATP-binding protein FtsE [Lysinibacter cavernae]|uniref:Cell division ATP-binding protein FtsE n=1 Tax=Lysinibacter cavernae TaxID=1640652 RepID=A0A7X5R0T3_9MICO|nr:cell division ATP-binding protein FtsE [Lysinibacter cavernae]NIH53553.1 cell division transport system ATP-binding protein [Lysinibacter cavernae]
MIWFDNVSKKYPGTAKPALSDINLRVQRGEFVFLVGASGSGKSSCLQLILREERVTGGKIHVLGQDLGSISNRKVPYFRRNLGVVFQDFRLLGNKSVYDNVAFSLQVIGKSRGFIQEAVTDTLEMVGLSNKAKRMPHELSGGEQQRVAIARAIVNKPAILLADEPTGNLDPNTSMGIMQLLQRINAGGTTVVMATHEAGFVDQLQQRVIELSEGQIVRDELEGGYGVTAAVQIISDHAADGSAATIAGKAMPNIPAESLPTAAKEPSAQEQLAAYEAAYPETIDEMIQAEVAATPHDVDMSVLNDTAALAERLRRDNDSDADGQQDVGPVR